MTTDLRTWTKLNQPKEEMTWKGAFRQQLSFVDRLAFLFFEGKVGDRLAKVKVPSTHTSKSIALPVYLFELERGARMWLRGNFHNWNVSVDARMSWDKPAPDFLDCFDDGAYGYCFCEGMKAWKFGKHEEDKRKFTACVWDDHELFVFCRVLKRWLSKE